MSIIRKLLGNLYPPASRIVHECWAGIFPKWYVKYLYKKILNKKLNLKNPKDFNEKIQWLKIYSDTSEWTNLADKYKVREYVIQCGLSDILIPLYGVWERGEDIDFGKLPDSFVLKANHGFGMNILVEDKNTLDIGKTVTQLNKWLSVEYGLFSFEPHYRGIERRIIAEELLQEDSNAGLSSSLIDYKFHCFHGEPHTVSALYDRKRSASGESESETEGPKVKASAFDLDWNPRPDIQMDLNENEVYSVIPKPKRLAEMINICRELSKPFPHVRVDLYEVNAKVYFGELTFTSGGGMQYFTPEHFLELGDKMDLSAVKLKSRWPKFLKIN